jgi:paired amphipathic helix protein Sin3a
MDVRTDNRTLQAVQLSCSGRDSLCWEVLNDTMVSHPTWAEEGFLAHRKNPFEQALHRSEEERHEYDYFIEANLRTIALLEPIANRINQMDLEEKANFRLKPGLGGQSKSMYQSIVKKVYGREQGIEVIAALHENPCIAVPIVLARLKHKDEEWKRALREWNRVWRDIDAKNFYKSLDHQGITYKLLDKKLVTSKSLVSEIEILRREQQQRRVMTRQPPPRFQLEYPVEDFTVLFDVLKLVFSFLDRTSAPYTPRERDRIETFLRTFVPLIFNIDKATVEINLAPVRSREDDASEPGSDVGTEDETPSLASTPGGGKRTAAARKAAADLRKRALRNAERGGRKRPGTPSRNASPASSRAVSPAPAEESTDALDTPNEAHTPRSTPGLEEPAVPATAGGLQGMEGVETVQSAAEPESAATRAGSAPRAGEGVESMKPVDLDPRPSQGRDTSRRYSFFCNSAYYCVLRLLQVRKQAFFLATACPECAADILNGGPDALFAIERPEADGSRTSERVVVPSVSAPLTSESPAEQGRTGRRASAHGSSERGALLRRAPRVEREAFWWRDGPEHV